MRIKFKKTAVEDMRATERYIREQLNNPSAAAKLTRRVYDAIMLLEDNPFMGTELCSRYAVDTDIRFLRPVRPGGHGPQGHSCAGAVLPGSRHAGPAVGGEHRRGVL